MKKLLLLLVAAAALAVPASALAWGGGHDNHTGDFHFGFAGITKLSGTGSSFGGTSATASGTGFSASLSTTWSSATTKTFTDNDGDKDNGTFSFSCAPSTTSITVGTNAAVSYTGKTCSWAHNGTTKYVFAGKASDGTHALLREDGTTVMGAVFKADFGFHVGLFSAFRGGFSFHH